MATCSSATATDHATGLLVRDALPEDAAAIAAIYAPQVLHGTSTYETEPPSTSEFAARIRAAMGAGHPWLVAATADGGLAGYAYASSFRARPGYRWTVEDSVYVAAGFQGCGVGGRLLDALIARCTDAGFRQMIAVIGDESNAASIALHARAGFVEAARFPGIGRKFGRWLTSVQMLRALGDGSTTMPFAERGTTA